MLYREMYEIHSVAFNFLSMPRRIIYDLHLALFLRIHPQSRSRIGMIRYTSSANLSRNPYFLAGRTTKILDFVNPSEADRGTRLLFRAFFSLVTSSGLPLLCSWSEWLSETNWPFLCKNKKNIFSGGWKGTGVLSRAGSPSQGASVTSASDIGFSLQKVL